MKIKHVLQFIFVLLVFGFGVQNAQAFVVRSGNGGNGVIIPKGEIINETLLVVGQTVNIDGDIKGDVFCAGQSITINGNIDGDILCAGQSIDINGNVAGNIRTVGQDVKINGTVAKNVTLAGQTINLPGNVQGEMLFAGQQAIFGGQIGKNVMGAAGSITVGGKIGGNVQFWDKNLAIQNNAVIGGPIVYTSVNDAAVESGAQISQGITRHDVPVSQKPDFGNTKKTPDQIFWNKLAEIVFYLVVALILAFVFKGLMGKITLAMLTKPGHSLGWGFLLLILVPMASIIVMFTIVGIPFALLAILLYAAALFFSRIFVAIAIGKKFTQMYWKVKQDSLFEQTFIGVIALWLVMMIPIIGAIIAFFSVIWGLGGLRYLFVKNS